MSFMVKESCISVEVLTLEPLFNVSVWLEIHVIADVPVPIIELLPVA